MKSGHIIEQLPPEGLKTFLHGLEVSVVLYAQIKGRLVLLSSLGVIAGILGSLSAFFSQIVEVFVETTDKDAIVGQAHAALRALRRSDSGCRAGAIIRKVT